MRSAALIVILLAHNLVFASAPTQIGSFELESDISNFTPLIKAETTQPIRFNEALNEVEVQPIPGFRSGYIAYGTCAKPGKIVRIKLKYKNSSKGFYEQLLEQFENRFGSPKWLGDSFHVVSIWKWTFEENGSLIDLYLQHNLGKQDEKLGNSVKLTQRSLVDAERICFEQKHPNFRKSNSATVDADLLNWEDLLPKWSKSEIAK